MLIHLIANVEKREPSDALVVALFAGEHPNETLGRLQELCLAPIRAGDFAGREGQCLSLWPNEPQEKRVFLTGLGSHDSCSPESLRRSYGIVARSCIKHRCKSLSIVVPEHMHLSAEIVLKSLLEGLFSAGYVFNKLKGESTKEGSDVVLEEITLIGPDLHLMAKVAERTKKVMTAVTKARDLINSNADEVTPAYIAQYAKEMSQEFSRIKTDIKDKAWIEKEGMGLLMAVSRAAACEPRFIICQYRGHQISADHTVLVGKGITYDTGGLKLKSVDGMLSMRSDMSGAAVALATIESIAALGLPVNVTAVIPACENAIGPQAYKLGDVYRSRSGLTVEVTNTDAEGRLVLADAISYAVDVLKPNRIIDIGTLTGSIEIALGNELMGLFSNSDILAEELLTAGIRTHERSWRMPLYEEYKEQLKSDVADTKNAATPKGGSIVCAKFIEQFVKNVPWAHIDTASVAFAKEARGYLPKNATAIGVRLLVDYLEQRD